MERKVLSLTVTISCIALLFASAGFANIPAPPVNQLMGFDDTIFNNLVEADCRVCHDTAVTGPTPNVDRHHLLYGSALPKGECSVNRNACLSDAECDAGICSRPPLESCSPTPPECDDAALGETCGEVCIGETVAPDIDANGDTVNDTVYSCLSCHEQSNVGGVINFLVERDCLQCHIQIAGEGSVHHLLPVAQGLDSPLGDVDVGDCTPCHGTIVDDIGDGHVIPTYAPSLVTPAPGNKTCDISGFPCVSERDCDSGETCGGAAPGSCSYCHDAGTDTLSSVQVYANEDNHHNTGVFQSETGVINDTACMWCHDLLEPMEDNIRACEGCHGMESLHNIQTDADGDCACVVGGELPGYGHVGADDPGIASDCWGCHGFAFPSASAPGSGPTTPFISSSDELVIVAGTDTAVTLSGTGFTNIIGAWEWKSNIVMTAGDGSTTTLTPDAIDTCACTVTIPGTTAVGNYTLQAVKGEDVSNPLAVSNPVALSVKPLVAIANVSCSKCLGTMTITGSGFGDTPPEGTEEDINAAERGRQLNIISWSDTLIELSGARCSGTVEVNALFGSADYQP